ETTRVISDVSEQRVYAHGHDARTVVAGAHGATTELRNIGARALDPELLHPAAQRVGMEPENVGRPPGPVDDPTRLLERRHDVAAPDPFHGGRPGSRPLP